MNMLEIKLPSAVTDGTLKRIDEFEFFVSGAWDSVANNNRLVVRRSQTVTVRIVEGDAFFTDSTNTQNNGKTMTLEGNGTTNLYISSGSAKILIGDKQYLNTLNFPEGRNVILTGDINYLPSLGMYYLTMNKCFFEAQMDVSKYVALSELRIANPSNEIEFRLSDFHVSSTIAITGTKVSLLGSVENLSHLKTLTLFRGRVQSGAAEDLFDGLFANGKVSGTLTLDVSGGGVTYNGQVINGISATFSPTGWTVN